jgi:hypothetical protein
MILVVLEALVVLAGTNLPLGLLLFAKHFQAVVLRTLEVQTLGTEHRFPLPSTHVVLQKILWNFDQQFPSSLKHQPGQLQHFYQQHGGRSQC